MHTITIINYGMGNIWSVKSALEYLGYTIKITNSAKEVENCDVLILPGVGSYKLAMNKLLALNLDKAIIEAVHIKQKKILGICLGIQLMSKSGNEDGNSRGLSLINVDTRKFEIKNLKYKIPHIGFNSVNIPLNSVLYKGLDHNPDFYFVHSYHLPIENLEAKIATCKYGYDFLASYENENVFGTQFHPEKSQTNGLKLLKNFLLY